MYKPNFIELCSGSGGLSSGLIKAGFSPILLNDIDKNCCLTLKTNHKDIKIIQNDFTKINYDEYIDKIDLLCAGCPCQSFSQSGKRKGLEDERGMLIFNFIEIVNLIKPKMFMIENVKGNTIKKILIKFIINF